MDLRTDPWVNRKVEDRGGVSVGVGGDDPFALTSERRCLLPQAEAAQTSVALRECPPWLWAATSLFDIHSPPAAYGLLQIRCDGT
jgi:hypothetical protein